MPVVYDELRRRARGYLRHERPGHTLQPTALVHETYLRLVTQRRAGWKNREHFYAIAAQMMRRILIDHARAHTQLKRSGQWVRVTLDDVPVLAVDEVDMLDLGRALDELAQFDPRKSEIAELRFFGGMSLEEAGRVLDTSLATVEREWQSARAWLYARLKRGRRHDA